MYRCGCSFVIPSTRTRKQGDFGVLGDGFINDNISINILFCREVGWMKEKLQGIFWWHEINGQEKGGKTQPNTCAEACFCDMK